MKKIVGFALSITICLSLTGCFNIIEEIFLNKDGSGTYVNVFDMSEGAGALAIFDTTGEILKAEKSLDSITQVSAKKLQLINGVSNVKIDDSKKHVVTMSLDFTDLSVLNRAIDLDKKIESEKHVYSWSKGTLIRKDGGISHLFGDDFLALDNEMMSTFFSDSRYKIIYHLPGAVKKMGNKKASLSSDKKTSTLEINLGEFIKGEATLNNEVKY